MKINKDYTTYGIIYAYHNFWFLFLLCRLSSPLNRLVRMHITRTDGQKKWKQLMDRWSHTNWRTGVASLNFGHLEVRNRWERWLGYHEVKNYTKVLIFWLSWSAKWYKRTDLVSVHDLVLHMIWRIRFLELKLMDVACCTLLIRFICITITFNWISCCCSHVTH